MLQKQSAAYFEVLSDACEMTLSVGIENKDKIHL